MNATDIDLGIGFGHGKVILIGEHSVVYDQPALAAGLRAGIRARATRGDGRLRVPAWGLEAKRGDGSPAGLALDRLLDALDLRDLDFDLQADIPSRCGLGSSAAMAVAVARAAVAATGRNNADVSAAVAQAETVFHKSPSGIDSAAAMHGGLGAFSKQQGWRPIALRQPLKILIGLTGTPHDTGAQVAAVARLCARAPVARRLVETLGEVALAAIDAVGVGDIDSLGRLFDIAHGLLAGLRVSSPALDAMVHGARAAGAIGAKLTGAGGGGAVIALAPSHAADVLARWRADGFDGFETHVGAAQNA